MFHLKCFCLAGEAAQYAAGGAGAVERAPESGRSSEGGKGQKRPSEAAD